MAQALTGVTLTAPSSDPNVDTGQTFAMDCSYTQAGHGGEETVSLYWEYATSSGGPYTPIPTSGALSTPTNPTTGIDSTVSHAVTITANTANTYYVHVRAVGDSSAASFENGNQVTTVNQAAQPVTITLSADSKTLSNQALLLQQATNITLGADSKTLSNQQLTISQVSSTAIDLIADSKTLSNQQLSVRAEQEARINLGADSKALSNQQLQVLVGRRITLDTDAKTLSNQQVVIFQAAPVFITPQADSKTLVANQLTITQPIAVDVTLVADAKTLANQKLTINQAGVGTAITLVADSKALTNGQLLAYQGELDLSMTLRLESNALIYQLELNEVKARLKSNRVIHRS